MNNLDMDLMRARQKMRQWELPSKNYYIAYSFGNKLTFNQIIDLWRTAVTEVLIIENINYLYELPYGKGYVMATEKWENLLKEAAMAHDRNA